MKSIIFNTEMVKAVLDGRKTQFRIAMEDCDTFDIEETENGFNLIHNYKMMIENVGLFSSKELLINWFQSKYSKYKVDDILYVKEKFQLGNDIRDTQNIPLHNDIEILYYESEINHHNLNNKDFAKIIKWKPSAHLKQKDARISLKVTNVRVERLDNYGLDVREEGIREDGFYTFSVDSERERKRLFIQLWNSTAKDRYKWEDNPYVFVYEFERINKED